MSITVTKTRDVLVDVARQLFARLGFDNTTMNDIAQASKKGRRTIYTYFKSKDDIFGAVIESEIDKLYKVLTDIAARDLPADEKLITLIYTRLDAVKTIVFRNGTLRALFFRDIWRVEKARKKFDREEIRIIKIILDDGVNAGVFDVPDSNMTAMIIHHALKGLEVPYIRGKIGGSETAFLSQKQNMMNLIFNGIKIK
ncbi:MAG: TetR/AcrR family transcriptional regulator [Tannerella sp.]|nr:TetR/AcrR family transcriptional regulator [Tannerella sp.]